MSDEKKIEYRVTSPIKHGGKRYEVGASILLTEEQAKSLHVESKDAANAAAEEPTANEPTLKVSPSKSLDSEVVYGVIDGMTKASKLKEFVILEADGGTEDRKGVTEAYTAKLEELTK